MRYGTPEAFRNALEARLNEEARSSGRPLAYLRKRVAFERFLARIFPRDPTGSPFVLKGAFALGLRIREKRTTQDLDLALTQEGVDPMETLRRLAEHDAGDFFRFRVSARSEDRPQEPSARRFTVEAHLGGRIFERFKLDVVLEPLAPESVETRELPTAIKFAGIQGTTVQGVRPSRHYADKLHAYTRPRRHRSRVKDFIDLALLTLELEKDPDAPALVRKEVSRVYALHRTHEPWSELPQPPSEWRSSFKSQAKEVGLDPPDMKHWFDEVNAFYQKLLSPSKE